MSFDTRNNSALMKRAEQLRRWEESDTNREPAVPKNEKGRKIKFSSGCVFLAACVAGDKDEVVRLLESGADINTANVDGLTALHQACIDDNLEMVEFLIEHGADINRQDNEGWTPLHATSSCGFVSIARYLVENEADLTAINSDGELAIDLAPTNAMADYLQSLIDELGIDCQKARQIEEQLMLNDAKKWLKSDASEADRPHAKTGATALHVAAAKGYTRVLSLLLAGRANVDKQDNDGWTPLHAAAHWGQKEAAEMLVDGMADIDIKNFAGQTPIDVAEPKMVKFLEELRANSKRTKRRPSSQIRISETIENHIETPTKVIRVEVKGDSKESEDKPKPPSEPASSIQQDSNIGDEDTPWRRTGSIRSRNQQESPPKTQVPDKEVKSNDSEVILRRTQSFENDEKFYQKYHELRARIKANSCPVLPATQTQTGVLGAVINTPNNFTVQRSASLKDHRHIRKPATPPVSPTTPATTPNTGPVRRSFVPPVRDEESETQRKAHAKRVRETRRSTQGVTLDEIKSAEELVKKKNLNNNNNTSNNNNNSNNETQNTPLSTISSMITSTTSTATAPLVKFTINDRVPSTATTILSGTSTSATILDDNDAATNEQSTNEISATYTIKTSNFNHKNLNIDDKIDNDKKLLLDNSDDDDNDDNNIGITYTNTQSQLTPPIDKTTDILTPSISSSSSINLEDVLDKNDDNIMANIITATINVPLNTNNFNNKKKTDDIDKSYLIKSIITTTTTTSPTLITPTTSSISTTILTPTEISKISNDENDDDNKKEDEKRKENENAFVTNDFTLQKSSIQMDNNKHDDDKLLINTNHMEQQQKQQQQQQQHYETNRIREKRSLFDIDNANSLTLAEKLRNEANKYNEASRSNNDITTFGLSKNNNTTDNEIMRDNNYGLINRKCDSTPSSPLHHQHSTTATERRPSWRIKFDTGSKFKLEDASTGTTFPPNNSTIIPSAPAVIAAANSSVAQRRNNNTSNSTTQTPRPVSAPVISTPTSNTDNTNDRVKDTYNDVTISLRRNKNNEDKDNDKENDSRSAQATQAVIQRRRRPKRRSTGVVNLDIDDIDPDRQDSPVDNDDKESGSEKTSRSRLGSTSSLTAEQNDTGDSTENGEVIDYKALWEAVKLENDKLKQQLKKKDDDISTSKATIERFTNATTKNSLSELEKRERRAMERKLSEMEEELKQLDILKTENQRLKEENGALIRVISKLSK